MAIKFKFIEPGMRLFDIHTEQAGNTTMRRWGCWPVEIVSVDRETVTARVRWNGNPPKVWFKRDLEKLYREVPPRLRKALGRDV